MFRFWQGRRGHRTRAHTADVIVEAWGASREECLEQAVLGLVSTFAEVHGLVASDARAIQFGSADDEEALLALLDEVIYVVDTSAVVPVTVALRRRADGGLAGSFGTVPTTAVAVTGALPKGISRSDLFFGQRRGRWRCRVEVDV